MTITEANAVNTILDVLFENPERSVFVDETHVREAAKVLAKGANKALMAGWRPEQIDAAVLRDE